MTEPATTVEPMSLAEIAQGHGDEGVANREAVFKVNDLAVAYGSNVAIRERHARRLPERRDRLHRARPAAARAR